MELLTDTLLPKPTSSATGRSKPYGSGEFFDHVHELVDEQENVVVE